MILRINQFNPTGEWPSDGWPTHGYLAKPEAHWPTDRRAFELFLLDKDEINNVVPEGMQQAQLQRILPRLISSMSEPGDAILARFDGPVSSAGFQHLFARAADPDWCPRFSISPVERFDPDEIAIASLRVFPNASRLDEFLIDPAMKLQTGIRLRIYSLPDEFINPFLDTANPDDERWREILPLTKLYISTTTSFKSVHIVTPSFNAQTLRDSLTKALIA